VGRPDEPGRRAGARIALAFVGVFFLLGIQIPYFPVWLRSRGLSAAEIGIILSLGPWMRVVANPAVGRLADRTGARRIAVVLGCGLVAAYIAFRWADAFVVFVVLSALVGATFSPLIPLTDALAVRLAAAGRTDYGRIRRWGSAAFIAATLAGGYLLEGRPESYILWTLIAAAGFIIVSVQLLPRGRPEIAQSTERPGRPLLRRGTFWLFLVTAFFLHTSHAVLYAFGTPYWRDLGIEESTIGWLWTIGVVAEIALFTVAPSVLRRLSPPMLLMVAGLGGMIRWPVLASSASLPVLFAVQMLHAATFAAMHLGAMEFIKARVEPLYTARATTMYSATSGVALGLGLPLAGVLFESMSGSAYYVMGVTSLLGLGLAVALQLAGTRRSGSV
jgi:PPP family 3-phenylpropionic acid transporter